MWLTLDIIVLSCSVEEEIHYQCSERI